MGFGSQSSAEKNRDKEISTYQHQIADLSTTQGQHGNESFDLFKQSAQPAVDYWSNILSGDKSAINSFLGPELSRIHTAYGAEKQSLAEFSPRGGARASGNIDLANREASTMGDFISKARPQAAGALGGLAGTFGGLSEGFGGQAIGGLGSSANIGLDLNKEQEAIRQRRAQMFAALGEAAGMIAGGVMTGGASTAVSAASKASSGGATNGPFGKF